MGIIMRFSMKSGNMRLYSHLRKYNGGISEFTGTNNSPFRDQWHHVVLTYDGNKKFLHRMESRFQK